MDVIARIAWDRLGLLTAPAGTTTPALAAATLAELARVGIRVTNPGALTDAVASSVPDVIAHERHRRGQRGTYAPLFDGFPDKLPSFDDITLRAILGASRLAGVEDPDLEQVRAAFDFTAIGWWPASSLPQDVPAAQAARARQDMLPADGHTEWTSVRLVSEAHALDLVRDWMADAFAAATSLRQDVRDDLSAAVTVLGVDHIDAATVRFRETRTLLTRLVWDTDPARIVALGLSPDDLLRLFADLSGGDVSLASPLRYPRLTRAQRRAVISTLEASERLSDVFRRRGMWLALGKGLHIGEQGRAPRTRAVFERLRATRHDHTSFASQFEAALELDLPAAVKLAADTAPGVLGRQVRRLASLAAGNPVTVEALCNALSGAAPQIPLRILLAARSQIADNGATYPRVAVTVRGDALMIDRPQGHLAVPDDVRDRVLTVLGEGIDAHLTAKGPWDGQSVWVAPGLDRVLVPEALRTTVPGLIQVERGSALPAGGAPVVRLFVHWRHAESDLDLSVLALGEDFRVLDQVSYTNLRNGAMVHSGDITSAPDGAQEFIDIDLAAARELGTRAGWRYLAPAIFRYSGPGFDALEESVAGWMLRESTGRETVAFDVATVAGAFELRGAGRTALPFVLDLQTGDIVYLGVHLSGSPHARVESEAGPIGTMAAAVVARRAIKTNVHDLVGAHVAARGGRVVTDREDATITVGTDGDCTYDVLRPEKFLADLL